MKYNDYRDTMTHQSSPRPKRKNTAAKEQEARFQAKNKGNKVDAMVASAAKKTKKKTKGRFGAGSDFTLNGKANVSAGQLSNTGMSLRDYMNSWKRTGKRPTKALDGTHTDGSKGSKAAMNRSRASVEAGTAQKGPVKIPTKPRAGDYKNKRLFDQAFSKWNNQYGKLAEGRKNPGKNKPLFRAGKQLADAKDTVQNRKTQRAKRMAVAQLGPMGLAGIARAGAGLLAGSAKTASQKLLDRFPSSRLKTGSTQTKPKATPKPKPKAKPKGGKK